MAYTRMVMVNEMLGNSDESVKYTEK
jgi:hypothetical protein